MTVNQMRLFLKSWYPNSPTWGKKVNKMPDVQVISIFNKHQRKNNKSTDTTFIKNPNKYFLDESYTITSSQSPDYITCPYCGASLDIDESCEDCRSH